MAMAKKVSGKNQIVNKSDSSTANRSSGRQPIDPQERVFLETIGKYLLEQMNNRTNRDRKMNQVDLGYLAFTNPSHVNKVLKGTAEPGILKFLHLCAALDVDPRLIIEEIWPDFIKYREERSNR
jgi:hypothetical protein